MRWILFPSAQNIVLSIVSLLLTVPTMALMILASPNVAVKGVAGFTILTMFFGVLAVTFPGVGRWGGKLRRGWFSSRYDANAREVEFGPDFVTGEYAEYGDVKQETLHGTIFWF